MPKGRGRPRRDPRRLQGYRSSDGEPSRPCGGRGDTETADLHQRIVSGGRVASGEWIIKRDHWIDPEGIPRFAVRLAVAAKILDVEKKALQKRIESDPKIARKGFD